MKQDKRDTVSIQLSLIGERIRTVRKRLGMTQEELADGDITRNMISRIENGVALPSLPSLCAICARLDIPVGALFDDLDDYALRRLVETLKKLESTKKYARAIETFKAFGIDKLPGYAQTMLCRIYIARAKELYELGRLNDAIEILCEAEEFSALPENKMYADQIFLLKSLITVCPAAKEAQTTDNPVDNEQLQQIIFANNELAIYLFCRTKLSDIAAMPYSQPHESAAPLRAELMPIINGLPTGLLRSHIEAKLDMLNADYLAAKARLLTLIGEEMAPSMLYDLYADLEFCCKCCGDFENAYKYSNLRIELLKKIN